MSGSRRRYNRRRTGSTSHHYRPTEPISPERGRSSRLGKAQLTACAGLATVAVLLIVLIWLVATRAIQDERAELRDHAEQALLAHASVLADEVGHELLLIDQSLTILQQAWKQNSDNVNLDQWARNLPALSSVANDLFIADEHRIVRQDILPAAVGQGIGAAYVSFPHGSLETFGSDGTRDQQGRIAIGDVGAPIDGRLFLMYVIRPLDHPKDWLVGASYRSDQLPKLFADATLGINGVAILVDSRRGVLQAIMGPSARRPKTDVMRTPMFEAIQRSESGIWLGPTATDDVERLMAFHRVPGRDIIVVVGRTWTEVMGRPTRSPPAIRGGP